MCSKTKVAPVNALSITRLELLAAQNARTFSAAPESDSLRARVHVLSTKNAVNSPWRHGIISVFLGRMTVFVVLSS